IAALFRKARGGQFPMRVARRAAQDFKSDWEQRYQVVEINSGLIEQAMTLAETHYLRGYDAIHLSAALEVNRILRSIPVPTLTFVSADLEQLGAAQAEGLQAENPNN